VAERPEQSEWSGGKLTARTLDVIVQRMGGLPAFPAVVTRVLRRLAEAGEAPDGETRATARDRAMELMACDPSLTTRVLALAAVGSARPAASVARAADALGLDAVQAAVLSADVMADEAGPGGVDIRGLWQRSLARAVAARMIALRPGGLIDADEACLCGLLNDLGMLMLATCMPKCARRLIDAVAAGQGDAEACGREILGMGPSVIGKRLAEQWHLPRAVSETIWLSGQPAEGLPESASAARIATIALADALACDAGFGGWSDARRVGSTEELAGQLGLDDEALAEVRRDLPEVVEQRWSALGLDDPDACELYREALARANADLGHATADLRRRAGELSEAAAAFEHLRGFAESLSPESTVPDVLERAARTMAAAIGNPCSQARPVVAYAAAPREATALVVRLAGTGRAEWKTVDAPALRREGADSVPRQAAQAVALLARDPSDLTAWVDLARTVHQPLVCAGQWIGGVFVVRPGDGEAAGWEIADAVATTVALALAMVQSRSAAVGVSEELAGASQALAAAQDALAEARTVSTAGEMAAGAAHELNTPLAIISGRAQLMRQRSGSEAEKAVWQLIADQAHIISDIISELVDFASPPKASPSEFDLGELLEEVVNAFRLPDGPQDAPPDVDIDIATDTPRIRADRAQIRETVLELMTNAATADRGRPRIRLEAAFDEVRQAVLLKVEDFGPGMDEETAGRAFTPFFSYQKAGRRRGMGLPLVKRIVENNGGSVWLTTRRGQGTVVFVLLPTA